MLGLSINRKVFSIESAATIMPFVRPSMLNFKKQLISLENILFHTYRGKILSSFTAGNTFLFLIYEMIKRFQACLFLPLLPGKKLMEPLL